MFTEILKIDPQISPSDLSKMENTLGSRFTKIAKGFGKGLASIFKVDLVSLGSTVIDKILNPLKETQDAIERLLSTSNDLSVFAKQFGTSSGALFKLQTMAGAKGISPDELRVLLIKFQGAITATKADPNAPSSVRNFTDTPDMAESFFQFVQSMQKLTPVQKDYVQRDVFGERQIGKMAEFLAEDLPALSNKLQLRSADEYTPKIERANDLSDVAKLKEARRNSQIYEAEIQRLTPQMITADDLSQRALLQKEYDRLSSYNDIKALSATAEKINAGIESAVLVVAKAAPTIAEAINAIAKSKLIRGIVGAAKDGP